MTMIARNGRSGNPLPFDALPRDLATDPKLDRATKRTDYYVAGRLLFHARQDDRTAVASSTIAREAGCNVSTVRRSIRRLEAAGWIRRQRAPWTPENATGRVIVLCWRVRETPVGIAAHPHSHSCPPPWALLPTPPPSPLVIPAHPPLGTSAHQLRERDLEKEGIENAVPSPQFSQSTQTPNSTKSRSLTPTQAKRERTLAYLRSDCYKPEFEALREKESKR